MEITIDVLRIYVNGCIWLFGDDPEMIAYAFLGLPFVIYIGILFFVMLLEFCHDFSIALLKKLARRRYMRKKFKTRTHYVLYKNYWIKRRPWYDGLIIKY